MTPDEQIEHIIKLMLEGEWKGSRTSRELAAGWGVHPKTVSIRAMSAAAVIEHSAGDIPKMVRAKLAELEHLIEVAMSLQKHVVVDDDVRFYPAPDVKVARAAIRDYLEILGAFNHTKKVEVTTGYENMTPAEKIAAHEKAIAEEREKLVAEKGEMH